MAGQPTRISRYEIKSRIGRGGMGDLYLAIDPNTNRLVALKLLNATLASAELRERFAREARALAALNHPNIVAIYDTGEFEGAPFIVMEYVRGETLAELIRRRAALSVSQKLELLEELCAGLAQAHEAGIVHRDIKPANLMVDQQNHLKILDFGIARVAEGARTRVGMPLTQVNAQIGTPGYMSPEQIEGGEVDHRTDIFAVGAVAYELLAYDEAFSGANTSQIESRVLRGQPRPLATVVPGLDPEIDEIVLRALKTDPNKRYQDAASFRRALEKYRQRLEPEPDPSQARPTPPPPGGARSKSREARAEAAYQRALASYQSGSRDAARRFAIEAIAEDSNHAGARALLGRLERRPLDAAPPAAPAVTPGAAAPPRDSPAPPRPQPSDLAPTMISTGLLASGPTAASEGPGAAGPIAVSGTPLAGGSTRASGSTVAGGSTIASGRTAVSGSTVASGSTIASAPTAVSGATVASNSTRVSDETRASGPPPPSNRRPAPGSASASAPTILVTPPPARARKPTWKSWFGGSGGSASGARPQAPSHGEQRKPQQPFWIRYRIAAPIAALVLLILLIGGGALLAISWMRPSGQLLTVSRPTGGTLSGPGIRCGTLGSDCSARRADGETVELTAQADNGFVLRGYTGDCAPGGLMIMKSARTCGATFDRIEAPPAATQTLTISPVPTGGTLEGIDILCGTKGSVCSANHPDGVPVELHPTADAGFTFMGFTGDCAPLGHTQMSGPRTCGATFAPTDSLKPATVARGNEGVKSPPPRPTQSGGTSTQTGGPTPGSGSSSGRGTTENPQAPPAPTPPVSTPPVVVPGSVGQPQPPGEPPKPPISDEDYAKNAVKDTLKQLCDAYEALDPDAAARVYPKVNMTALKLQLNKTMYKSVQCKFAEPTFQSLDPAAGTARIRVEVKRVFEHTALDPKPEVSEQIATMALSRPSQRARWVVDSADYRPKPKDK